MRRSPADPRQPQDQRLFMFLLIAASIAMFWSSMNPQAPVQPADQAAAEQAEDGDADAGTPDADDSADGGASDQPATDQGDEEQAADAPIEDVPLADEQTVVLGSADAASPYRMLMTLTNEGAAIRRIVLSSDDI